MDLAQANTPAAVVDALQDAATLYRSTCIEGDKGPWCTIAAKLEKLADEIAAVKEPRAKKATIKSAMTKAQGTTARVADLKHKLQHAVTEYDRQQERKPGHNRYALAHYLGRVSNVLDDIAAGAPVRGAIVAGFSGPLLNRVLKAAGEPPHTDEEARAQSISYRPVAGR